MGKRLERELKSDVQSLADLAGGIEELMLEAGVPRRVCNDVLIAVDEIFSNIMIHGYGSDPGGSIRVAASVDLNGDNRIEITFADDGIEYEPQREDPRLGSALLTEEYPGLGLFITRNLMDEFRYERVGGENRTRLVKKIA